MKLGLLRRSLVAALLLGSALHGSAAETPATHPNIFDARSAAPTPHRTASRVPPPRSVAGEAARALRSNLAPARPLAAHALRREKDKTDARAADVLARRVQDSATDVQPVAALPPDSVPAQESPSEAAQRLGTDKIAMKAFEDRSSLHLSCETLQKAARLFAKSARYDKARAQEDILKNCGPQTLAYTGAMDDHMALARATEYAAAGAPGGK